MIYPQKATPMQIDNSTVEGITNAIIKQKSTKAMDMRFYWVNDIIHQGHYNVFWKPGENNLAYYFTKHPAPHHHFRMLPVYLNCKDNGINDGFRGCYYSKNTSLNKYQSKNKIRKKAQL